MHIQHCCRIETQLHRLMYRAFLTFLNCSHNFWLFPWKMSNFSASGQAFLSLWQAFVLLAHSVTSSSCMKIQANPISFVIPCRSFWGTYAPPLQWTSWSLGGKMVGYQLLGCPNGIKDESTVSRRDWELNRDDEKRVAPLIWGVTGKAALVYTKGREKRLSSEPSRQEPGPAQFGIPKSSKNPLHVLRSFEKLDEAVNKELASEIS